MSFWMETDDGSGCRDTIKLNDKDDLGRGKAMGVTGRSAKTRR
ncbi:hypothetical protein [Parasphingorhabdus sp.]